MRAHAFVSRVALAITLTVVTCPSFVLAGPKTGLTPVLTSTRRLGVQNTSEIQRLFGILDSGHLHDLPGAWFGDSNDPSLPDLIYYFPFPAGKVPPIVQLVQNGETKQRLHGARFLWAIAFVETEADSSEEAKSDTTKSLQSLRWRGDTLAGLVDTTWNFKMKDVDDPVAQFRFEPLDYRRGLGDLTVIKGIAGLLSEVAVVELEEPKDESTEVKFTNVGRMGPRGLVYATSKFALRDNSVNRVRLALGDTLRTYASFGNYDDSYFGLSVAIVAGLPARRTAQASDVDVQAYLPIHLFLNRPERPRLTKQDQLVSGQREVASSVFVAPTVSDNPFGGFMVGYGAWDALGSTGIVIGPEFRKAKRADESTVWHTRWSIGFSFGLQ